MTKQTPATLPFRPLAELFSLGDSFDDFGVVLAANALTTREGE
jgi:hypothetical protein